jgi:transcriptional regulator with XRE-family HTH domain
MPRNWTDVRADSTLDEQRVGNAKKLMREELAAHKLADIRKRQGMSQTVLAKAMGVAQPRVSAIENGRLDSAEFGTLRSYVEGIGGHLKIVADFGDESIIVQE